MTTSIRITNAKAGPPRGGFAGALVGGTEPGDTEEITLDTDLESAADIVTLTNAVASAFRDTFRAGPVTVTVPAEFVDKVRAVNVPGGALIMPDELRTPEGDY